MYTIFEILYGTYGYVEAFVYFFLSFIKIILSLYCICIYLYVVQQFMCLLRICFLCVY
jgi:hypothetical protein